ncbi:hypothetical protein ACPUER_24245 [Burkholderia sp. DN3021]|uniref:hypothetical protein n=1 Tax=Burkholderia sp. DN3021 TaxID=3410137 RepID=UPI003C7E5408
MTACGMVLTDVDILFRDDSKPCDFKGEGTERRFDVDNPPSKVTRNAVHSSGEREHAQAG